MAAKSKMCVNFQSCCSHISQYENLLDDTVPQPPKKYNAVCCPEEQ